MGNESTVVEEKPVEVVVDNATLGNVDGAVVADVQNPADEQKPVEGKKPKEETHDYRRMVKHIERAEKAEEELAALKAQISGGGQNRQPAETQPLKRENFESEEAFIQAQVDQGIARAIPRIQEQIAATTSRASAENTFQQREVELRKEKPDYDEVIADAGSVRIPPIVVEAILTSDLGPDLRYYLAQNPEKAQKLNYLPPVSAARELGKIEAQIIAEKNAKPTVKVSGAPAPIKPVVSNGVTVETSLEKLPMNEYFRRRNEERKKLGKQY
jgi:hypothetical protein